MPAAARFWNDSCGREVQLKIWIGNTVNRSSGPSGVNGTNVNAPMVISGADSPIALEAARMFPVIIPGIASGSTWCQIVCQRLAPTANEASRRLGGTARSAS